MDLYRIFKGIRAKIGLNAADDLAPYWYKRDGNSTLEEMFSKDISEIPSPPMAPRIEELAQKAAQLGELPLWEGFEKLEDYPFPVKNATRNANQVRIGKKAGALFYHIVRSLKPETILEIGTAFGVSGMYWLSGIVHNQKGKLLTFEPNKIWAKAAKSNLSSISSSFVLTTSTFEEEHNNILKPTDTIGIAFIDAIHQKDIVNNQFDLISNYTKAGSLVLFDDIDFSRDMWDCWKSIAYLDKVKASCSFFGRLGIVELN